MRDLYHANQTLHWPAQHMLYTCWLQHQFQTASPNYYKPHVLYGLKPSVLLQDIKSKSTCRMCSATSFKISAHVRSTWALILKFVAGHMLPVLLPFMS